MDLRKLSDAFCLNSLDSIFCGICGNELEELALIAWGQKSLFPRWPTLHHLFCYSGVVTLRRDILIVVHPFMTHNFYCSQDCTWECAQAHIRCMLPLGVLACKTFWENYSAPPQMHQRKEWIKQRSWWYGTKSVWDAIRSTPGASPPRLSGWTGRNV